MGLLAFGQGRYSIRWWIDMSYIHEALNKAQKERDAHHGKYSGILSNGRTKKGIFSHRPVLWTSLAIIVIFLAFAYYSWLDSRRPQPLATSEHKYKMPAETSAEKPVLDAKEYCDRGMVFYKKGRLRDAKQLYGEALKIDPGYVDALNNLAVIYMHEKNFSAAQRNLEKAIRLKPADVDPYYNLACVFAIKGEVSKSLSHLKKAVSMDRSVRQWAQKDADLNNVRGAPEFEDIIR
jgi:Tfp pilus assembly protein PilF